MTRRKSFLARPLDSLRLAAESHAAASQGMTVAATLPGAGGHSAASPSPAPPKRRQRRNSKGQFV